MTSPSAIPCNLLQKAAQIDRGPVFDEPSVGPGAVDVDNGEVDLPAGRGDAQELPRVGAANGDPLRDPVTFGDLVFYDDVEVRERPMHEGHPLFDPGEAWSGRVARHVVDVVGGDELLRDGEVALGEYLFRKAASPGLQLAGVADAWVFCHLHSPIPSLRGDGAAYQAERSPSPGRFLDVRR